MKPATPDDVVVIVSLLLVMYLIIGSLLIEGVVNRIEEKIDEILALGQQARKENK